MEYQYIATTRNGEVKKGSIEAASRLIVREQLQSQDLVAVSIKEKGVAAVSQTGALAKKISWGKSSLLEKVIFAKQLSVMLRAGLPLAEALGSISEQPLSKKMQTMIAQILKDINNGQSLASALERFPKSFSGIFIGMVKVGEASGTLERNLDYVATELEKDYELQRKVKSAMLYPVIVLSATFILGIGMTIFILPKMVKMFSTFKLKLPVITQIFLSVANFLVHHGLYLLVGLAAAAVVFRILLKTPATRPFFHKIYLKIPVINNLVKNLNLTRLTRALSILLKSGITINESLAYTALALGNVYYQREVRSAMEAIKKGKPLASALVNKELIPSMVTKMISVGEKTGKLEETLFYLSDYYDEEVNNTTKNISTVIEPILLVVIGVVLGFLAVAIISPIYQFTGSLQR